MIRRLLGLVALVATVAAPMTARANTLAVCTFESQVYIYPGVSMEPKETWFYSEPDAPLPCTGTVLGQSVAGPGGIAFGGNGGHGWIGEETCIQDTSAGWLSMHLPAPDSHIYANGLFTAQRIGVAGAFDATIGSVGIANGTFQFLAAEGQDCVNERVTQATVMGQFVIVG